MSTPWPAPSVARALLEAVLWKPRIRWVVREIWLLAPVRYARLPCPEDAPPLGLRADEPLVVLQDLDLLVRADLYLNPDVPRRDAADNHGKYAAMFQRRLAQARGHHEAFFGLRSFPAELLPVTGQERPVPLDLDWGDMRGDWDLAAFEARAVGGIVEIG